MKAYVKRMGLQVKERPFNVGGDHTTEFRFRNRYKGNAKLRRDRINRSYKKSVRQSLKIELRRELEA